MKSNYQLFRAPARLNHDLSLDPEIFNLTMTVRLDSDIPWPYGEISDIRTGNVIAPALDVNWNQPEENFEGYILNILTKMNFDVFSLQMKKLRTFSRKKAKLQLGSCQIVLENLFEMI